MLVIPASAWLSASRSGEWSFGNPLNRPCRSSLNRLPLVRFASGPGRELKRRRKRIAAWINRIEALLSTFGECRSGKLFCHLLRDRREHYKRRRRGGCPLSRDRLAKLLHLDRRLSGGEHDNNRVAFPFWDSNQRSGSGAGRRPDHHAHRQDPRPRRQKRAPQSKRPSHRIDLRQVIPQ